MAREYRKREEEGNELIRRFEDHIRKKKAEFFDLDAYEQIIDFYMFRGKHNKALQAVNQAISQYPFSTELITVKAQILSNLEEYEEALDLLDQANALQPNDPEIARPQLAQRTRFAQVLFPAAKFAEFVVAQLQLRQPAKHAHIARPLLQLRLQQRVHLRQVLANLRKADKLLPQATASGGGGRGGRFFKDAAGLSVVLVHRGPTRCGDRGLRLGAR